MKALISPTQVSNYSWVSNWFLNESVDPPNWVPIYSEIQGCIRVAEVEEIPFPVAEPLYWMDCPDNCKADLWYLKDGVISEKPQDVPPPPPPPPTPVETLP